MAIRGFFQSSGVRNVLLVALVLVVLLTGIPVLVGGSGMGSCPDCGAVTLPCSVPCAALPPALVVVVVVLFGLAFEWSRRRWGLELAWSIDPPPRLI
ncbi:hypothetical protein BH20ACT2_BH20ACT2_03860 [soil metagenome]